MKLILFIASPLLLSLIGCDSKTNSRQDYSEAKQTIEEHEAANPLEFLEIDATYRVNLVGKFVFEGTIRNKATKVSYKDVVVQITYFSRTDSKISTEDRIFYEFYEPVTQHEFKFKLDAPSGAEKAGLKILSAKTAQRK